MKQLPAIFTLLLVGGLAGCDKGEINWVQFNKEGQELEVDVLARPAEQAESSITDCEPLPTRTDPEGCTFAFLDDGGQEVDAPACAVLLQSNLGLTTVGYAMVDPASAPIGTEHTVAVFVCDEFKSQVGRATVVVESTRIPNPNEEDPETREGAEFEMRRDSANIGSYALTLQSLGGPDESGTDTFTIRLFQPEELAGELAEGEE